jgi:carboxyl-terminal processing protease
MPRRNLYLLLGVVLVAAICYQKVQKNRYGPLMMDVMNLIERRYLEPVAAADLFQGAVEGMVGRLDTYSAYIAPAPFREFQETLDQEFGGVGMEVAQDPKTKEFVVISPLVGTPAYEAGVRAGDHIVRINGQSTQGFSLQDTVRRMRGKPGDPVTVSVRHEGEQEPVDIVIVRAVIRFDTVLGDARNSDGSWNYRLDGHPQIGYLRITSFGEKTAHEMAVAMAGLTRRPLEGLILDLRDDPGGLLDAAVAA